MNIAILIISAFLTACTLSITDEEYAEEKKSQYIQHAPGRVYDFFLEDGTRCVYIANGLSCDFWPTIRSTQ